MDFPDPSELWNYRQRLQRHGFSPAEATAVFAAVRDLFPADALKAAAAKVQEAGS